VFKNIFISYTLYFTALMPLGHAQNNEQNDAFNQTTDQHEESVNRQREAREEEASLQERINSQLNNSTIDNDPSGADNNETLKNSREQIENSKNRTIDPNETQVIQNKIITPDQDTLQGSVNTGDESIEAQKERLKNEKLDEQKKQNIEHAKNAKANGGVTTYCNTLSHRRAENFNSQVEFHQTVINQNLGSIRQQMGQNQGLRDSLSQAGALFKTPDQESAVVNLAAANQTKIRDLQNKKERLIRDIDRLEDEEEIAQLELNNARNNCGSFSSCSSSEQIRLDNATRVFNRVSQELNQAKQNLLVVNNEIRENDNLMVAQGSAFKNAEADAKEDEALMATSLALSGCGETAGTTDNRSESSSCQLTGPILQADDNLTSLINSGTQEAQRLARTRAKRLADLELENQFNGDFQLFEAATNDFVQGDINSRMATSNLNVTSIAAAAIKNLKCKPHPRSEGDSKSYHLFQAASATFLIAAINDTGYFNDSAQCRLKENYTDDDKNTQLVSFERAANLKMQQLESLCQYVTPLDPTKATDREKIAGMWSDAEDQGETANISEDCKNTDGKDQSDCENDRNQILFHFKSEAEFTGHFTKIKNDCLIALNKIRGEELSDTPRTREAALMMYEAALEAATDELKAKQEKITTAHAQVMEGEQRVEEARGRIKSTIQIVAAYVIVSRIYLINLGICLSNPFTAGACSAPLYAGWSTYHTAAVALGAIVSNYYNNEKKRHEKFVEEWKQKRETAGYFTHLTCNYNNAEEEEAEMVTFGKKARKRLKQKLQKSRRNIVGKINDEIQQELKERPLSSSPSKGRQSSWHPNQWHINQKLHQAHINSNDKSSLSLYLHEWFRIQTGADRSLPYDAKIPQFKEVVKQVRGLGVQLLGIEQAFAQEVPTSTATPARLGKAMGLALGSTSFEYFLTKRNYEWKNLGSDITYQRTKDGSQKSNSESKELVSVAALAAPFMGEALDGGFPINKVEAKNKVGIPVPETRVVSIQNTVLAIRDNIFQLNSALSITGAQLRSNIKLVEQTRDRLGLTQGLSDIFSSSIDFPSACDQNPNCKCRKTNTCLGFAFPEFPSFSVEALASGEPLIQNTLNALGSENSLSAGINSQKIKLAAVRTLDKIAENKKKINENLEKVGQQSRNFSEEAKELQDSKFITVFESLANFNPNDEDFSKAGALSSRRFRRQSSEKKKEDLTEKEEVSNSELADQTKGGDGLKKLGNKNGQALKQKQVSLADEFDGGYLDLEELTDEERAQLGLAFGGDITPTGHQRKPANSETPYKLAQNEKKERESVHKDRDVSLFKIISHRYQQNYHILLNTP
jgi:hypothetical protein